MKIGVIGDVHGCRLLMIKALKAVEQRGVDRIVFLGDLIDRGPDSAGCVRLAREYVRDKGSVCLMGNHEDMMIKAHTGGDVWHWIGNGGQTTLDSYKPFPAKRILDDVMWMQSLPRYHETNHFIFVHAGLDPDKATCWKDTSPHDMTWIRDPFLSRLKSYDGKLVVFGHTIMQKPLYDGFKLGLDTGAFHTGMLTFAILDDDTGEVLSVESVTGDYRDTVPPVVHIDQGMELAL